MPRRFNPSLAGNIPTLTAPNRLFAFDQSTGRHMYTWHRGQNHTLGDWLLWLVAPLHFGTSWGQTIKALWVFLGLALPLLTITGMLMYWNRWLGKHWAAVRQSTKSRVAN